VILLVYIREAHPASAGQTAANAGWKAVGDTVFHQPQTFEERQTLAETACTFWDLPIPTLVDAMEPSISGMYRAWPNRLYLLDLQGKIVFRGPEGPQGVNAHEGEIELRKLLGLDPSAGLVTRPRMRSAPPVGARAQ